MKKEERLLIIDEVLGIEFFRFKGLKKDSPVHFHDYFVIRLIFDGSRRMICDQKEYLVGPGDILLFEPGMAHGCIQENGAFLEYLGLNISLEVMNAMTGSERNENSCTGFASCIVRNKRMRTVLEALYELVCQNSEPGKRKALFKELGTLLDVYLINKAEPVNIDQPARLNEVLETISIHYGSQMSLQDLSDFSRMSPSSLQRAFKKEFGLSPWNYLESIRISKARENLLKGQNTAMTSLNCGFYDQAHFTNRFLRITGLTSGMYRRKSVNRKHDS